jgi:hypothetical protein
LNSERLGGRIVSREMEKGQKGKVRVLLVLSLISLIFASTCFVFVFSSLATNERGNVFWVQPFGDNIADFASRCI